MLVTRIDQVGRLNAMSPQSWKIDTAKAQSIHLKLLCESFSLLGKKKKKDKKQLKQLCSYFLFLFYHFTIATCCAIFYAPFLPIRLFLGEKKSNLFCSGMGGIYILFYSDGHL